MNSAPHVLLLEDNRDHRDLILRAFSGHPDRFLVSVAKTLAEARQLIAEKPADVIIADWNLPDGKGLDILPRNEAGFVTCPVIVMTGYGDEELAVGIMKSGAMDYVSKDPETFEKLPDTALRVLREWENIQARKSAETQARDADKRFFDIIEFLPDAAFAIDNDGQVIAWNHALSELTGISGKDMIGKGNFEYSIPFYGKRRPILIDYLLADHPDIEERYVNLHRFKDQITAETTFAHLATGKGSYLWITARPLYNSSGERTGAIEVIRDITDRKQSEEEIRQQKSMLETILNVPLDTLALLDRNGTILRVNDHGAERFGTVPDNLVGKNVYDLLPPDIAQSRKEQIEAVFTTGRIIQFEDERSGLRLINTIYPVFGNDGKTVEQVVVFASDITAHKAAEEKLRESEERYRTLLNGAGIGVGYWSPDGTLLYLNEISLKRLKGKLENFVGKHMRELFQDKADLYLDRIRKAAGSDDPQEYEDMVRLPCGDGWYLSVYTRITGSDKRLLGIQVLSIDISERKRAEKTIRESEERFRGIIETMQDAYFRADARGILTMANPAAARMYGYSSQDEMIGIPAVSLYFDPEDRAEMFRHMDATGMVHDHQGRGRRKEGSIFWVSINVKVTRDPDGKILQSEGFVRDVTDRMQAEKTIRESEEKYRFLVETIHDIVWQADKDLVFTYISPACRRMGYEPEELVGQNILCLISERSAADLQKMIQKRQADPAAERPDPGIVFEVESAAKDKSPLWLEISSSRVFSSDGNLTGYHGVVRDITERKRSEEALHAQFEALAATERQIRVSEERLRKSQALGHVGSWEFDPATGKIWGSDEGFRIYGLMPPENNDIPIKTIEACIPEKERVHQALVDLLERDIPYNLEFAINPADGSPQRVITSFAEKIRDQTGRVLKVTGVIQDITDRRKAEAALRMSEERLRLALEGAGAASWDWDVKNGTAVFSEHFYSLLGYEPGEFPSDFHQWKTLIHPDDQKEILPRLFEQIQKRAPVCEIEYRIRAKDGGWQWILGRGKIVETDQNGNALRLTGINLDITNRKLLESEIRSLNTVLEERVKDRTEALTRANAELARENLQRLEAEKQLMMSVEEKTMLLKEVHHRVKNNLQIITSLLNLQSRFITDKATLAAIKESQNRVRAMALVHEKLYKSENISRIDLFDYIKFLGDSLFQFYGTPSHRVRFMLDAGSVNMDINGAIPLGLIINELISNSLKYAFPENRRGEISITIVRQDRTLTIIYHDTGIGIPAGMDWRNTQSLGLRLVNSLVDQLNGTIELDCSAGTQFTIIIHEKEDKEVNIRK